jgi:hypothetical protein
MPRPRQLSQKERERRGKERDRVKKAKKRQNEESRSIERKINAAAMKRRRLEGEEY